MRTNIEVGDVVDYRSGYAWLDSGTVLEIDNENNEARVDFADGDFWTSIDNLRLVEIEPISRWDAALDEADEMRDER